MRNNQNYEIELLNCEINNINISDEKNFNLLKKIRKERKHFLHYYENNEFDEIIFNWKLNMIVYFNKKQKMFSLLLAFINKNNFFNKNDYKSRNYIIKLNKYINIVNYCYIWNIFFKMSNFAILTVFVWNSYSLTILTIK